MEHLPVLVILLPLCGILLCPLLSWIRASWGKRAVMCGLLGALLCAVMQLALVVRDGEALHYWMGGWMPPFGIEFVIDGVNGTVVVLVAVISFLTSLYSSPFQPHDRQKWFQTAGYCVRIGVLAVGLLGMASTGGAFNL